MLQLNYCCLKTPLWIVILLAPLNCGKITLHSKWRLLSRRCFVCLSLRKQFNVSQFKRVTVQTKTIQPLSQFNVLLKQNSALIRPIVKAFDGELDSLKKLDACVKKRVLENLVLQKSR